MATTPCSLLVWSCSGMTLLGRLTICWHLYWLTTKGTAPEVDPVCELHSSWKEVDSYIYVPPANPHLLLSLFWYIHWLLPHTLFLKSCYTHSILCILHSHKNCSVKLCLCTVHCSVELLLCAPEGTLAVFYPDLLWRTHLLLWLYPPKWRWGSSAARPHFSLPSSGLVGGLPE